MKKETLGLIAVAAVIFGGLGFVGYKLRSMEPQIDKEKVVREYERQIDDHYGTVLANFKFGTYRGRYADMAKTTYRGMTFSVVPDSVVCSVSERGLFVSEYICKADLDIAGHDKATEIAQKDGASMRGLWNVNAMTSDMTFIAVWP